MHEAGVSRVAIGNAASIFLALTFALCVRVDLLFPERATYRSWQKLVPGFG